MQFIISFVISALMGLGVGGGGLFIIYLTQCMNFDQLLSQGTNLVFFILATLSSLFIHFRKRKINFGQVFIMCAFGIVGSLIFSHLANVVSPEIPRKMLGGLLALSGVINIVNTFKEKLIK